MKFKPPTVEEVRAYIIEKGYQRHVKADRFCLFYEQKGWMVGKSKMQKWRAAVSLWARRNGWTPPEQQRRQDYRQNTRETHEDWLRGQSVAKLEDMSAHLDKAGYYGQIPGWLIREILKERQDG
jgi:hypothetical protein